MSNSSAVIRDISDTARWVAHFRAKETSRPDALFRDPYAERLAGSRGHEIASTLQGGEKHDWAWVARTYLFDQFLLREIKDGADLVLNLAAGLDARPYRMELPPTLLWVEVDLPELIAYKQEVLADDRPACQLQRISLDLADVEVRSALLADVNGRARKIVVVTEGLLIYFTSEQVASLAKDLAARDKFRSWVIDLASPGQLKLMQRSTGKQLSDIGAAFKFGPPEGPKFFSPYGWEAADVQGLLKTAASFNRAPSELLSLLPEPKNTSGNFPWTGVCLLKKV
jgi:methyltransferase (TIGR00027 family)